MATSRVGIHAGRMEIPDVMHGQGGVIARRQVLAAGADDTLIERMLRRNEWRSIHRGVYVDHTGVPSREQQRMAAVLFAWPAALSGESALVAQGVRTVSEDRIRVVIDAHRRVVPPSGVAIVRLRDFVDRVLWNRTPPRLRLEEAGLDVASRQWVALGERGAVAVLADLCQQRLTTPGRLRDTLERTKRLPGRSFIAALLDDVASGAHSLLEHRYLTRVERAHGLPRARRQSAFSDGHRHGYRDVHYVGQGVVIELDGRLGHEFAEDQWADLERDLCAAADRQMTARLGWGPVTEPCRLAPMIGRLLQSRGWAGRVGRCRDCAISGEFPAPGADNPPLIG